MKKAILFAAALFVAVASFAQNEYNYQKRSLFEQLPIRGNDIVFLGNSITDGCEWAELFNNRHIKNRGISADRSGWLLDRLDPVCGAGHDLDPRQRVEQGGQPVPIDRMVIGDQHRDHVPHVRSPPGRG